MFESARSAQPPVTGAHLVALVRAGTQTENDILVKRQEQAT
ncbi:hypothetical protein ACIPJS_01895 [Streptomyces sp. NPDC086783]